MASLVLVLPTEPVTAMIFAFERSRDARPSASSARAVSSTSTCGASIGFETIAPAAPAAIAPATNSCPSWTVPGIATNKLPGPTSRLSNVTPVTSKSPLALPPVASAISADVHSGAVTLAPQPFVSIEVETRPSTSLGTNGIWCARSCRALAGDDHVVEREHPVADDLALLVALAGDQHDVARAGDADRLGDGFAAAEIGRAHV